MVGAGASGLAAALALDRAGLSVRCLEARPRVGGRLLSIPVGGGALDLGAAWFWPGEQRVARLLAQLGLPVHAQHLAGDALYDTGGAPQRLDGNPVDVPAHRFGLGAQSLATALAALLPADTVELAAPVRSVVATPTEVVVTTGDREVRARHVVLALPPALAESTMSLGTLRPGTLRPGSGEPLPEPLLGLVRRTPVWMGTTTKVVVAYATPFWRDQHLAGSAVSHVGPLREIHDTSGPQGAPAALFGFLPSGGDAPTVGQRSVAQLVRLFGPEAGSPHRVLVQDWSSEAETSSPATARLGEHGLLGHPLYAQPALHGRLHWAGTETSPVSPGHVEGALAAGERAAAAVLAALR